MLNKSTINSTQTEKASDHLISRRTIWVNGPVIVGAGPSGLAVGACLRDHGVPFTILEKSDCIASLWKNRTYNRLNLHLPKQFCQLPKLAFPEDFPEYPSKNQFISYLETYAKMFEIRPQFNECVQSAKCDGSLGVWRVETAKAEYVCRWLVVATGENAERVVPKIEGMEVFEGRVMHACDYKTGEEFQGMSAVVVGCGNSGLEVSLDLSNHNAVTSVVCRNSVHVLPREILGKSTYELAFFLLKWLPLGLVDKLLLIFAWLILGNIDKYGLKRPSKGPIELKNTQGKTPVLDIGALSKIRSGEIKVVPGIRRFSCNGVELVNGEKLHVDSVILATGYRSNVPYWLQDHEFFDESGFPRSSFPNGWKGKGGLYAVGFTRRGLAGASMDAVKVAQDIGEVWKKETKQKRKKVVPSHRCCISTI